MSMKQRPPSETANQSSSLSHFRTSRAKIRITPRISSKRINGFLTKLGIYSSLMKAMKQPKLTRRRNFSKIFGLTLHFISRERHLRLWQTKNSRASKSLTGHTKTSNPLRRIGIREMVKTPTTNCLVWICLHIDFPKLSMLLLPMVNTHLISTNCLRIHRPSLYMKKWY